MLYKNKFIITASMLLLGLISTKAQVSTDDDIALSDLKAPSAPAFTILEVQPTEIAKPKDFKAFEASFLNNFTDGNNNLVIPRNYAIELNPYLLFASHKFTFDDFIKTKKMGKTFYQNLSLSLATSFAELQKDTLVSIINDTLTGVDDTLTEVMSRGNIRLGVGFRTYLFNGHLSKNAEEKLLKLVRSDCAFAAAQKIILQIETDFEDTTKHVKIVQSIFDKTYTNENASGCSIIELQNILTSFIPLINDALVERAKPGANISDLSFELGSKLTSLIDIPANSEEKKQVARDFSKVAPQRVGFFWEIAGALAIDFLDERIDSNIIGAGAFWSTWSYRQDFKRDQYLDGMIVTRYKLNNYYLNGDKAHNFDLGFKVNYQVKKFNVAFEFLTRHQWYNPAGSEPSTHIKDKKFTGTVDYKLSEKMLLNFTVGRDFTFNTIHDGNIIASAGFNLGFGSPTVEDVRD